MAMHITISSQCSVIMIAAMRAMREPTQMTKPRIPQATPLATVLHHGAGGIAGGTWFLMTA